MTDYDMTDEKVSAITEILKTEEDEQNKEQLTTTEQKVTEKPIGVYVKINDDGYVTEVGSEIFISNFDGWVKIDEGFGDRFAHAQSHYFDKPLVDENGNYLIKFEN